MIEYNYKSELHCQLLSAHIQFLQNNQLIDPEVDATIAEEGLISKKMTDPKERSLKSKLSDSSTEFITIQAIKAVRIAVRALLDAMSHSIRERIDNILIPLGKHDTKCVDKINICEFIRRQNTTIFRIQKDINRELTYFKRLSTDTKKYKDRYDALFRGAHSIMVDYKKWIEHSTPMTVEIRDAKLSLRNFEAMIDNLHQCEAQLAILENDYRTNDKINSEITVRVDSLLAVINKMIQALTIITNALEGALSPITGLKNSVKEFLQTNTPSLDRYNVNNDIKLLP